MSYLRIVLGYLKVLSWPLLIVGLLIVYRPPVGELFSSLVQKLDAADSVKFGSFSLEVQHQAADMGHPELGREIGRLSYSAVEELVRVRGNDYMDLVSTLNHESTHEYGIPNDQVLTGLRELDKKHLIEFNEPLDPFLSYVRKQGKLDLQNGGAPDRQWYVPSAGIDQQRIEHMSYHLTDAGRKAVEAITKAVASQLANPTTDAVQKTPSNK